MCCTLTKTSSKVHLELSLSWPRESCWGWLDVLPSLLNIVIALVKRKLLRVASCGRARGSYRTLLLRATGHGRWLMCFQVYQALSLRWLTEGCWGWLAVAVRGLLQKPSLTPWSHRCSPHCYYY